MGQNRTDFYDFVAALAKKTESMYTDRQVCRVHIYEFMELNEWFGLTGCSPKEREQITGRTKRWMVSSKQILILEQSIILWLRAYQRTNHEKLSILLEHGKNIWPETIRSYGAFLEKSDVQDEPGAWQLLDYLLAVMEKELFFYSSEETEKLIKQMSEDLSLSAAKLFSSFLKVIQEKKKGDGWVYKFNGRGKQVEKDLDAYPMKDFSVMAYCIFNQEAWENQQLLEKACNSETYANLWAFLAMHFVCGLRGTDIVRLPMVGLPFLGEEMRRLIHKGNFREAKGIADELQIRVQYKRARPNKTKMYGKVPEIKLFIPESLKEPLGIVLALAASYCRDGKPGEPFLKISRDIIPIRNFFGNEFVRALGGRSFSTRRANKSYLQGISMAVDTKEQEHPKGYMLAALARSHKGGIGTLPEMTEIYLKDAAFTGYSPEFIAREMFERGVFGFIPYLLLRMYGEKEYTKLPITVQTKLIKKLGVEPAGIESMIRLVEESLLKAEATIKSVLSANNDIKGILQQVAAGTAVGKQRDCLCLMSAAGFGCQRPERKNCMGCRFEIYTKTTMHFLVREYVRLSAMQKNSEEGWRYQQILKEGVLPAVTEMLASIKSLYPDADMDIFAEIMEGGMTGYAGCIQ